MRGFPIVGDFDGDGLDDLATWNPGNQGLQTQGRFEFDLANNGLSGDVEQVIEFDLSGVFERPVAADMNGDGIDDIGLFVSRREGVTPEESGEWFFLISDDPTSTPGEVTALDHRFTPVPFGTDIFAQYGDEQALPVVGNFDPPVGIVTMLTNTNIVNHFDVNYDFVVSPLDALLVINALGSSDRVSEPTTETYYLDVNADGYVSPLDALLVISHLDDMIRTAANTEENVRAPKAALAVHVLVTSATVASTTAQPTTIESPLADAVHESLHTPGFYVHGGRAAELQRDSTVFASADHDRFVRTNLGTAREGNARSALEDDLLLGIDERLLDLLAMDRLTESILK